MKSGRVGLVVNPLAGGGLEAFRQTLSIVLQSLGDCTIVSCCESIRGLVDEFRACGGVARQHTMNAVEELIRSGVGLIVVLGGDGTASDAAFASCQCGSHVPLLCAGVGSTNAGSLIGVKKETVSDVDFDSLEPVRVGGLVTCLDGVLIGIGFNDVVLGTTVLATVGGRVVQVDAAGFLKGERVVSQPWDSGDGDSVVCVKRRGGGVVGIDGGFGQLFVGVVDERYRGKGVAGGVSLTSAFGIPAALALVDKPVVNYDLTVDELFSFEPVTTRSVSLEEGDLVCVEGVRRGVCLNIDGTPLSVLSRRSRITVWYEGSLVTVLK